jgi:hypothetical protein
MTVLVRSKAGIDPTGSHWPAHGEMAQIHWQTNARNCVRPCR